MDPWIPPRREFWVGEKRWLKNPDWYWRIPPRKEIWSKSHGSHPKEKLGWENRTYKKIDRDLNQKKVDLGSWGHDLKVVQQQQQQQQQQQLSPFYDLSASPQVRRGRVRNEWENEFSALPLISRVFPFFLSFSRVCALHKLPKLSSWVFSPSRLWESFFLGGEGFGGGEGDEKHPHSHVGILE